MRRYNLDIVEVYNGHHWATAQCLPKRCYHMKSTVLNRHWYLMGQGKEVYYASLDSLVANSQPISVWRRLSDVPHEHSSPAVFGNRLIAIGGTIPLNSSIHAYLPHTQTWLHVGDMPVELHHTCIAVLTTGELMLIGNWSSYYLNQSCVYQATLNGNDSLTCENHKTQHDMYMCTYMYQYAHMYNISLMQ